jgi:hypothetical protein
LGRELRYQPGETRPTEQFLPNPRCASLKGLSFDDLFSDLIRDASGKAVMWVQGKSEKVEVAFGLNYQALVVYAPAQSRPAAGGCVQLSRYTLEDDGETPDVRDVICPFQ